MVSQKLPNICVLIIWTVEFQDGEASSIFQNGQWVAGPMGVGPTTPHVNVGLLQHGVQSSITHA